MKGQTRFNFRTRLSQTFSDNKRVHPHCMGNLPNETRLKDMQSVVQLISEAEPACRPMLQTVLGLLQA